MPARVFCRSNYILVHSSHSWSWCGQWSCPQDDSQRTCLGQEKCIRKQKRNAAQRAVKINERKLAHFCLTDLYCPLSPICWFMVVHFIYFLIPFFFFASLAQLQISALLLIAIACYWLTVTQALSPHYRDWIWNSTHETQHEPWFIWDWDLNQTWSHSFLGMEIFPCLHIAKQTGICFACLTSTQSVCYCDLHWFRWKTWKSVMFCPGGRKFGEIYCHTESRCVKL